VLLTDLSAPLGSVTDAAQIDGLGRDLHRCSGRDPLHSEGRSTTTHAVGLNFTAMGFETANSHRGSVCSVGMVRVRDNVLVESTGTLVTPPGELNYFDSMNTWLHGIDSQALHGTPVWSDALGAIMHFVGDDVVVFHNAAFNLGVIRQACVADDISWPRMHFFCALAAARRTLRLPSYRLAFVAEACCFAHRQQYNAREDAAAVACVAIALAQQREVASIEEWRSHRPSGWDIWMRANTRPARHIA
jgi:DNA polymerase III epsilon subunit-like protein